MKWCCNPTRCGGRWIERSSIVLVAAFTAVAALEAQALVSFPTSDGGVVYAHDYGAGERTVVLAHGGRFTKESWAEQAEVLVTEGFRVLALDFRGRGMSRGGPGSDDDDVQLDVLAAVQYLRNTGARTISLVGASFGGWAVARAATELTAEEVDAVVLLAHSPIDSPEAIQGRKLFITTREDFSGNGRLRLPDIREQYERAAEPKQLVILEGSAHAQHIFATELGPRLLREIVEFLVAR